MAYKVVGVKFKRAGKIYYFDPAEHILSSGNQVIVETARGIELGQVVIAPTIVTDEEVTLPLKKVLRPATKQDKKQLVIKRDQEKRAFKICLAKIKAHNLPMKLIKVEQAFDRNKIIFYFTAEGRIDFRELVKDLAAIFRTRIELRQIGVRDEVKLIGGIGCCGRELCCNTWLTDFTSVSIRMAKEQNLALNPTKISGVCGRLMCCLKYENELYEEAKGKFPEILSQVITPLGPGKVITINIFKETLTVELLESKVTKEYALKDLVTEDKQMENKKERKNAI